MALGDNTLASARGTSQRVAIHTWFNRTKHGNSISDKSA